MAGIEQTDDSTGGPVAGVQQGDSLDPANLKHVKSLYKHLLATVERHATSTSTSPRTQSSVGLHGDDLPVAVVVDLLALDAAKVIDALAELTVMVE